MVEEGAAGCPNNPVPVPVPVVVVVVAGLAPNKLVPDAGAAVLEDRREEGGTISYQLERGAR